MTRPFYTPVLVLWTTSRALVRTLVQQHLGIAILLTAILLFSFLAFTPVLSPFVYPLF
jgi:hypothetical protein